MYGVVGGLARESGGDVGLGRDVWVGVGCRQAGLFTDTTAATVVGGAAESQSGSARRRFLFGETFSMGEVDSRDRRFRSRHDQPVEVPRIGDGNDPRGIGGGHRAELEGGRGLRAVSRPSAFRFDM